MSKCVLFSGGWLTTRKICLDSTLQPDNSKCYSCFKKLIVPLTQHWDSMSFLSAGTEWPEVKDLHVKNPSICQRNYDLGKEKSDFLLHIHFATGISKVLYFSWTSQAHWIFQSKRLPCSWYSEKKQSNSWCLGFTAHRLQLARGSCIFPDEVSSAVQL